MTSLNARALEIVESLVARAEERKVELHPVEGGGRFLDCGIKARGGTRRSDSFVSKAVSRTLPPSNTRSTPTTR